MFEYMGDRISNAIKNIKGMGRITEENIGDAIREIQMLIMKLLKNLLLILKIKR